jgi:hypothetical protein
MDPDRGCEDHLGVLRKNLEVVSIRQRSYSV